MNSIRQAMLALCYEDLASLTAKTQPKKKQWMSHSSSTARSERIADDEEGDVGVRGLARATPGRSVLHRLAAIMHYINTHYGL